MTRIGLMSDLHLECEPPSRVATHWLELDRARKAIPGHPVSGPLIEELRAARPDVVLIAGDTDLAVRAVHYADAVSRFVGAPVVQVAGNHEARGRDLDVTIDQCRAAAAGTRGRVTFLEDETVTMADLSIAGSILWTDYALHGHRGRSMRATAWMDDHALITIDGELFSPGDALARHRRSLGFLRTARADVVLTHHAPVPEGVPPRHAGSVLAPGFASDLTADIRSLRPRLWVFGHTHHDVDMPVGATRVLSAQRGYVGEEHGADTFRPKLIDL